MPSQEQSKPVRHEEDPVEPIPPSVPEGAARREALSDDIDAVLDDIDGVLEVNAEEFVRGFVQKGGQ